MSVTIKGLDALLKKLDSLSEDIQKDVDEEMSQSATTIAHQAASKVPVDEGRLKGAIKEDVSTKFRKSVSVNLDYAPFIEFGTKKKVSVPNGLEAYAAQFKKKLGKGGFEDMVKALSGWLKRHGQGGKGLKNRARMLALKILRNGIRPQPYLFPSFFEEQPKLMKRLEEIIDI